MASAKLGRPSSFSQAVADAICVKLADGISLREICRDDAMPDKSTVLRWLASPDHVDFRDQYARAREAQADHMADEILEIADDGTNDWMERRATGGGGRSDAAGEAEEVVPNHEHINRSKLRVDARKWLMSKLAPKKYGDKITHAGDPDNPMTLVPAINVTIGSAKSPSSSEAG
jgi:hypothetical protein